jgi:hypothetical protein
MQTKNCFVIKVTKIEISFVKIKWIIKKLKFENSNLTMRYRNDDN